MPRGRGRNWFGRGFWKFGGYGAYGWPRGGRGGMGFYGPYGGFRGRGRGYRNWFRPGSVDWRSGFWPVQQYAGAYPHSAWTGGYPAAVPYAAPGYGPGTYGAYW